MKGIKSSCKTFNDSFIRNRGIIRRTLKDLASFNYLIGYPYIGIKEEGGPVDIYIVNRERWVNYFSDRHIQVSISVWTLTKEGLLKGKIFGSKVQDTLFFQDEQILSLAKGINSISIGKEHFNNNWDKGYETRKLMNFRLNYVID